MLMFYGLAHFLFACNYYECSIYLHKVLCSGSDANTGGPKLYEKIAYYVLLALNIIIPSYISWNNLVHNKYQKLLLQVDLVCSLALYVVTCAILGLALYRIN
jgi:hypothetical protein